MKVCDLCGAGYEGFGHNAAPLVEGRCCDDCNTLRVLPERLYRVLHEWARLPKGGEEEEEHD